jgi:hypothetical protein
MMSSGRMRKSLGIPPFLMVVLFVAPKPVADAQPLWAYDTGG